MDRRRYYEKQLVDEDDLNAGETNTYNAIGNMMSDIGIFGIISGGDITEQGVPSMSVDMSTPFIGYDQDGERIYKSTGDVIDCSVDYLGNPTVPTVPGEKVWISIHGRFTYTEEDPKVIDGSTEYLTWKESYEWRVVAGTPAGGGGHTKPAKPADALLIADIELDFGHTTILTADIDESGKDTFVFTNAAGITVSAGAWTKLDAAAVTVQDALDSADTELLLRNALGEVDQDVLPVAAGTRDLGAAGNLWAEIHAGIVEVYTSLLASANGKALGSVTARFEGFFNTLKLYTKLEANATGVDLGDASARFDAFLETITHYGALKGTMNFDAAKSIVVRSGIDRVFPGSWVLTSNAYYQVATSPQTMYVYFNPPEDVTLDTVKIRWYQAVSTTLAAQVEKAVEDNAGSNIGVSKTIGGAGSDRWDTIFTGGAEVIDKTAYTYRVKVTSATAENNRVFGLELTYDITDILAAALAQC